jgi:hypothetical protein
MRWTSTIIKEREETTIYRFGRNISYFVCKLKSLGRVVRHKGLQVLAGPIKTAQAK